ncbi:MAG: pilin [Minisyncoccia bacterium]
MRNFLLPLFVNLLLIGSITLPVTFFVTGARAQSLPNCFLPSDVNCINIDGTVRPGENPQTIRPQDPVSTTRPAELRNETNEKICAQIAAQPGGIQKELDDSIVPCGRAVHQCLEAPRGNEQCEFRHLFVLVNNLVSNFITKIFAPLLVIVLMYIGFLFIKEKAGAKTKAKMLLTRVLVGTFFVLAAWLIVNFILQALGADGGLTKFLGN